MGRKLQIILGFSLVMIFASSAVPADSNFSMFDLSQAFAQTNFGPPGVEEGDIVVISPFNGLCFPFPPCGERFGAVFEIARSDGTVTKIFDSFLHGFTEFAITPEQEFEIDIAIDPFGKTYVLDNPPFPDSGSVYDTVLPCLVPTGTCDVFSVRTTDNFNDPLPPRPVAMDTSSSAQIYVVGPKQNVISPFNILFDSGLLVNIDITNCDPPTSDDVRANCSSNVVSDWSDSTQGVTWPSLVSAPPETADRNFMVDVTFAEAPVGAAVHDTAYVLEKLRICSLVDTFDSDNCIRFEFTQRVWAVDINTGNREIINTFNDATEGPVVLVEFPHSIAVMNSGNLLVSSSFPAAIYEINPNTRTRTLFSDFSDANQGITGSVDRGLEVERTTGLIFGLGAGGLFEIDPATGFRTLISDLEFVFDPTDIFTISPFDLAIVPEGVGPDRDGDGVPDGQDPDPDDPCNPNPSSPACDTDGDGVPDGQDPDPDDPCNPNPSSPACDTDGDGVPDSTDPDPNDPCNPNPSSPACTQPRMPVGGEIIPLDTTMVLIAGTQGTAAWCIPAAISAVGIVLGLMIARRETN